MNHASDLPRSPTVLRLRAPVAADGTVTAFGLTYRPHTDTATLHALARVGWVSLLIDAADIGTVLVREPVKGFLVHAECTRHAYACGLSLPVHAAARRMLRGAPCHAARLAPRPSIPAPWHGGADIGSGERPDAPPTPVPAM